MAADFEAKKLLATDTGVQYCSALFRISFQVQSRWIVLRQTVILSGLHLSCGNGCRLSCQTVSCELPHGATRTLKYSVFGKQQDGLSNLQIPIQLTLLLSRLQISINHLNCILTTIKQHSWREISRSRHIETALPLLLGHRSNHPCVTHPVLIDSLYAVRRLHCQLQKFPNVHIMIGPLTLLNYANVHLSRFTLW